MKLEEILKLRDVAEHTCVQFKERVTKDNKSEVAAEMVAMSNTRGGKIIVGIDDKTGHMNPLSYAETQDTTELLGNLATQNVIPSVLLDIITVPSEGGALVVAIIKQGLNKPYHDNNGVVWVKQGADKRKVFDNRIELHSPGLLPPGITVEDATHGVSSPRNKLLFSNGIHLLPYTGAGSGLTRAQLYTPDIKFENDERLREFVVTIWRESVRVIDDVRVGEVKKLNNSEISNDTSVLDLSSDTVTSVRAERIPYKLLGGVMKNIIQFCSIPRTGREILEHIGYSYHTKNLAKFITPLLDMNYLEPTIPDKPKSPHQRYRKKQK